MKRIPIKLHTANAIKWLGSLYRTPADALKEHISNAIDEHVKAQKHGGAVEHLRVVFTMFKDKIQIDYPYGMSERECQEALQRVADSQKQNADVDQIGRLGIGMFSFIQVGKKCVMYSRKTQGDDTFRTILREDSDEAQLEKCSKQESLPSPGIRFIISPLREALDPMKSTGPLSVRAISKSFADRFDAYLRNGTLSVTVCIGSKKHTLKPEDIKLPRIAEKYGEFHDPKDHRRKARLDLYFHPSGKGTVKICHMGVVVVEDLRALLAYGLEESVYAGGDLTGSIHAEFLTPLPSRTGFEDNADWMMLLDWLDKIKGSVEREVEEHKRAEANKKLTDIQRKAIELAREILNADEFEGLEFLDGLGRKPRVTPLPPNGFDFVPASRRIDVGQSVSLSLKARVPGAVADGAIVHVDVVGDGLAVPQREFSVKAASADKLGIVTLGIPITATHVTTMPVVVSAQTDHLRAEARVRVAPRVQTRGIEETGQKGPRFSYVERSFDEGPEKHSRFSRSTGQIEINQLNEDYRAEMSLDDEAKLCYAALMIGKETLAYNDAGLPSDDILEKMLTFHFRLKRAVPNVLKKPRGRPRKAAYDTHSPAGLF